MDALRIVFLDRDTLPKTIDFVGPNIPHELVIYERTAVNQVEQRIKNFDVVITNKVKLTAQALQSSERLRMVAVAATGCDNVDLGYCDSNNIIVSNVRNYAVHTVPEHTFALILALRRNLLAYRNSIAAGRWQESGNFCYFDYPITDLAGSTLGIIGQGVLGEAVAELARAFGMKVQFVTRESRTASNYSEEGYTDFQHVLRTSDIISLHCPLTEETKGLISAEEFRLMQARKPLLINTARGGLVDEQALEYALLSGQISGAGFDVASAEPPAADHPFMRLLKHDNFILTPHVAWSSAGAIKNLAKQVIDNIEAFYRDEPRNVVAGFKI